MKQEIIKVLGQDTLRRYFEEQIDVREVYDIIDEMFNVLDISEDDLTVDDGSTLSDNFPQRQNEV